MSNADILVEMIRLADQFGCIEDAHLYHNDFITIEGKIKSGKKFSLSLSVKEDEKNA